VRTFNNLRTPAYRGQTNTDGTLIVDEW